MKLACGPSIRDVRLDAGSARLDDLAVPFEALRRDGALEALRIGGKVVAVRVVRQGDRVFVWSPTGAFEFRRAGSATARRGEHAGDLLAPMPGRVRRVVVPAGEKVHRGDVVLVLEAMKMEHSIRAPRDGVVTKVFFGEGDLVEAGAMLAEIT